MDIDANKNQHIMKNIEKKIYIYIYMYTYVYIFSKSV